MVFQSSFFPRAKTAVLTSLDRITGSVTDFIRGNPIVSTAAVGIGTTGLIAGFAAVKGIRKKRKKSKPRKKKRKVGRKKKTRRTRKARCPKKRRTKKRRVIRGRGIGTHEIRHSGRKTKGKFKLVSFRNKKTGKMVRFKVRK